MPNYQLLVVLVY